MKNKQLTIIIVILGKKINNNFSQQNVFQNLMKNKENRNNI